MTSFKEQLRRFHELCGKLEGERIRLGRKHAASSYGLFLVLIALNRLPEGIHQQEQSLKADPLLPLNHYFMTRLQVCRGDYERAYEHAR